MTEQDLGQMRQQQAGAGQVEAELKTKHQAGAGDDRAGPRAAEAAAGWGWAGRGRAEDQAAGWEQQALTGKIEQDLGQLRQLEAGSGR